ncbi:MAG: 30S ribosomal protein S9, partial [candidate division WOR-3 bacterium]
MAETIFATGSRKTATARLWLMPAGNGITVNGRPLESYFGRSDLVRLATAPLHTTGTASQFGATCTVAGGGLSAQAGAVSLALARALVAHNPDLRKTLKSAELLKRDPREKERMKYGL